MKNRNLIDSFNNAISGIVHTIKAERNMKIHIVIACVLFVLSIFFNLSKTEFIVVCLTVALIIVCELFNTAIEEIMNMVTTGYHPKVKIIKDVSAGAVLVSAFFSVIIGYFVFFEEVSDYLETGIVRIKRYPMHIAIIAIVLSIFVVLILKAFSGKGTPLKGGMPSGHAAIASTITTTVALWSINTKITILCIILSVLVIQSRIEAGIHTFFEVFIGSVVGFVLTLILFLIFLG